LNITVLLLNFNKKNNIMKNLIYLTILTALGAACSPKTQTTYRAEDKKAVVIEDSYTKSDGRKSTSSTSVVDDMPVNTTLDIYLKNVAGVNVNGSGSRASVTIRGISSFAGSNEPLFVVDSVQFSDGYASLFYTLNANDIKSVSVLKDAASTAIYGSRASNGVIIISMKKAPKK
jgi:TonB-dependent SusC/RagA subfamily outer membrane receptor